MVLWFKMSQYKPRRTTVCVLASYTTALLKNNKIVIKYKTMVLYEAMGIKCLKQLIIKKFIEKKMRTSHLKVHNVRTDEGIRGYRVNA